MSSMFEPATTVSAAIASRHSIRAFLDRPVDAALLRELLEKAARAPSGGNLQPWRIVALGGEALAGFVAGVARRIAENPAPDPAEYAIYPQPIFEPYRSNRYRAGEMLYESLGIAREQKAERLAWFQHNYAFFGAPVGLMCYVDRRMSAAQWADLGMYLQSLMLLLRERGLDSCPQECWSVYHRAVDELLQPGENLMLFCGLAIGYADPAAPQNHVVTERLPLAEFAQFKGI